MSVSTSTISSPIFNINSESNVVEKSKKNKNKKDVTASTPTELQLLSDTIFNPK